MMTIAATIEFIIEAHGDQRDKSGREYWLHPVSVMIRLGKDASETERQVALLHDVLEDTAYTADDLIGNGWSEEVVDAVQVLTRPKRFSYEFYIDRIATSGNRTAIKVKLADLDDNLDPARIATMPADDRGIIERYRKARPKISAALCG